MTKTHILSMIMALAGYENVKINIERLEDGVEYSGKGERKIEGEIEPIEFQSIGFEFALADLLAKIYETSNIDFETNAAIIFD